jgi:creatinine amidohydrolase
MLNDIATALEQQSIQKLCIVNSHLEPAHIEAIHEFCSNYQKFDIRFPDKTKKPWASLLTEEFKKGACHAGSYETSLVLASRPDLVKEERLNLKPLHVNLATLMKQGVQSFKAAGANDAYFGDPASASKQEGEEIYTTLTRMVVETVLKLPER